MVRRFLGTVAATVLVAATGAPLPIAADAAPAPVQVAGTAACSGADGVTVVVDFNELGGGISAACDPAGAGKAAAEVFPDVGYPLVYSQEGPGFVCRVSGEPADNPCMRNPPATAYWSLWWSDGKSGKWAYSSDGVSTLSAPDGGYLAFSWHQGSGNAGPPDAVPTAHPEEEPESPSADDGSTDLPEVGEITDGPPAETTADDEGSSFPTWIAIGLAVLVIGAAGAVPLIRRRAG